MEIVRELNYSNGKHKSVVIRLTYNKNTTFLATVDNTKVVSINGDTPGCRECLFKREISKDSWCLGLSLCMVDALKDLFDRFNSKYPMGLTFRYLDEVDKKTISSLFVAKYVIKLAKYEDN